MRQINILLGHDCRYTLAPHCYSTPIVPTAKLVRQVITQGAHPAMQTYDIIMIVVLVAATVFGALKGLAWQLASLASIFVSYYVAYRFRNSVAELIDATSPWNTFLAMLLLFVGSSFVIWTLFRLVSQFIDRVRLKEFDRQIGALFGFGKGVVLCVIVTLFAVTLLGETQRQSIVDSKSGYYIALLLDRTHTVMPEEIHEVLEPYIHKLDGSLNENEATANREDKSKKSSDDDDGGFFKIDLLGGGSKEKSGGLNMDFSPLLPGGENDSNSSSAKTPGASLFR